jgi:single-strand DNA-binding protein
MNKVSMIGRLTDNPQQFVTNNNVQQAKITIATTDNKNRNESYFFPCVAWQTTANYINTYLKKGDLVFIDGHLTRRSFLNKEGKQSSITEIIIDSINLILHKKNDENNEQQNSSSFKKNIISNDTKKDNENVSNNSQENDNNDDE